MTPARPPGTRSSPRCRTAPSSIAPPGRASSRPRSAIAATTRSPSRMARSSACCRWRMSGRRLFGNTLVSTPFCVYGGPLAVDPETAAALEAHADDTARQARRLRGRTARAPDRQRATGWSAPISTSRSGNRSRAITTRNMKAIPRKQRAMVRKGIQNGLVIGVQPRHGGAAPRLCRERAQSRNAGVLPPLFRHPCTRHSADCSDVVTVLDDDKSDRVSDELLLSRRGAAVLRRRHRAGAPAGGQRLHVLGSDAACRRPRLPPVRLRSQQAGHRLVRLQAQLGIRAGDGCTIATASRPVATIPDHNPLNPKYRLFIAAWKRLPLPVANLLGPPIVRGLG